MPRAALRFAPLGFALLVVAMATWSPGQEKEKKFRGRLPPYYSSIVTDQQRQAIYQIQAKYDQQLTALKEQIEAVENKRDAEIEGVLTAEQKLLIKKASDEAAAKRKKGGEEKVAAADAPAPAPEAKKATKKTK